MNITLKKAVAFTLVTAATIGTTQAGHSGDLAIMTCKDVMRYESSDRDISISFLHGYLLGKKNTTQYDVEQLGKATDAFFDYCLDNPKASALNAMSKTTD